MSTTTPEKDLLSRSRDFRRDMLTPSGGWLHDIVVGASSLTGLSDYFLLGIIFVGSWCILRLAEREVALILGLGFDLTIPLQHSLTANPRVKQRHQQHMEQYWPFFFTGMAIEFACLLFVHPTMFTLVVCLKTTVCTAMWFYQGPSAGAAPSTSTTTSNPKKTNQAPKPAPEGGDTTTTTSKPKSEIEATVTNWANFLRANGFGSATACKMLARRALSQYKGPAKLQTEIERLIGLSSQEKEKLEIEAKAVAKKMEEQATAQPSG